jgi:hypothetical protein
MILTIASNRPEYLAQLEATIRLKHHCGARHWASVGVTEDYQGHVIWSGAVEVFELIGHGSARRCYAWMEAHGHGEYQYVTVLGSGIVNTPQKAVKAWLASKSVTIHPVIAANLAHLTFTWPGQEQWASPNVQTNKSPAPGCAPEILPSQKA